MIVPRSLQATQVVWLVSDCLCCACHQRLQTASLEQYSDSDIEQLSRLLHLKRGMSADSKRDFILAEQRRLDLRRKAMLAALEGNFDVFSGVLADSSFDHQNITKFVDAPKLQEPAAVRFYEHFEDPFAYPPEDKGTLVSRSLGIEKMGPSRWFALPVLKWQRAPKNYSQAENGDLPRSFSCTGRPGFCPQRLWLLRAWCMAKGGFHSLGPEDAHLLLAEEAKHDCDFTRSPNGAYVLQSCPMNLDQYVWLQLCHWHGETEAVSEAFFKERRKFGLSFTRKITRDIVTDAVSEHITMDVDAQVLLSLLWKDKELVPEHYKSLYTDLHFHVYFTGRRKNKPETWPRCLALRNNLLSLFEEEYEETKLYYRLQDASQRLAEGIAKRMERRTFAQWQQALCEFLGRVAGFDFRRLSIRYHSYVSARISAKNSQHHQQCFDIFCRRVTFGKDQEV